MSIDIPASSTEHWDLQARRVKRAKGGWVIVAEYPTTRRGGRNDKVKEALTRRGLSVEVKSRLGRDTSDRPWEGWRTWARVKS
jgi:hypothetical protein